LLRGTETGYVYRFCKSVGLVLALLDEDMIADVEKGIGLYFSRSIMLEE
jgi:hypothetical protein